MALTAVMCVSGVQPASAHESLAASIPAEDARLDQAPSEVTLQFNGPPLQIGASIVVADAAGQNYVEGGTSVNGVAVTAKVRALPMDANYQVRWQIVSADGAVVSSAYGFSVGDATGAPPVTIQQTAGAGSDSNGDFAFVAPTTAPPVRGESATNWGRVTVAGLIGALSALGAFSLIMWLISATKTHTKENPT